jgi:hypothetical protein
MIRFVGQMAIIQARSLAGLPTDGHLAELETPTPIVLRLETLQTKRGIDTRQYRKEFQLENSGGYQNMSAVVIVSR